MRVFVTGATGWIGSAVVPDLRAAGHEVVGLARSDASAAALHAAGARAVRGGLHDLDALRAGAQASDAVVHLAFEHDFSRFAESAVVDEVAIRALADGLEGSGRPLVIASGMLGLPSGRVVTEDDQPDPALAGPRLAGTRAAQEAVARGVRPVVVRLSPAVHGDGDPGFVAALVGIARERGVSGYPGEGSNFWPAVHRLDAARLFRLAVEKAPSGAQLNGVADSGVPMRAIAGAIGRLLGVPTRSVAAGQVQGHFGWLAHFVAMDIQASHARTSELVGWEPTQPGLLDDLAAGHYLSRPSA